MALVILSAGTLTQSRVRTISVRMFAAICGVSLMVALGGGVMVGRQLSPDVPEAVAQQAPVAAAIDPSHPDGRLLIDRFGELAGKMVQLELEAAGLAERIGVIADFEARIEENGQDASPVTRAPRTPPARSAGGPLLDPLSVRAQDTLGPVLDLGLSKRAIAPAPAGPLSGELDRIERDIARVAQTFSQLDRVTTQYTLAHMSFPGRAPVPGVEIGSDFGNRLDPFRKRLAFHSGVDFSAPTGTPILASAGGRVVYAGFRPDYGRTVEIDHGAGVITRYAHASRLFVKKGDVVMPKQKIAAVGSSGRSTGPHLHFEVIKDGMLVDPAFYLAQF